MSFFARSPETSYCALGIFAGLGLIILGSLLPLDAALKEKVVLLGISLVSGAAGILALLARSEAQSTRDTTQVIQQIKSDVKGELASETQAVAATVAKSAAQQVVEEQRHRF